MLTALASVIDAGKIGDDEVKLDRQLDEIMDTIADPAGTFYRFSMSHSILHRARVSGDGQKKGEA
jgi:F420-non-reducing hydrogenase small subunit